MKKAIIFILTVLFMIVGCNDDNSILEPTNDISDVSLNKGRPILALDLDGGDDLKLLDDYSDLGSYHVNYSQNFTINGDKGGRIAIKHQWKEADGRVVWLKSELIIPSGAFKGVLDFDMIFDLNNLSMELYPSPFSFDKPVEFSMYWYGLDLEQYKDYDFDFNYLDGEEEQMEYYRKSVDITNGNLIVWGAKLHHFSRYGWVRTK